LGQIVRAQHAPFLLSPSNDTGLELVAAVSPNSRLPDFAGRQYPSLAEMLAAEPEVSAVSIASPTMTHAALAREAITAGRHVLLEKPPTTTLSELRDLARLAEARRVVLCTSFHARHNASVDWAQALLADTPGGEPDHVSIEWREDFDRWHAGQTWPWREGGFGVFDPGVNALSILVHLLPGTEIRVLRALFELPAGSATPSRVEVRFGIGSGGTGDVVFEWRRSGEDVWDITLQRRRADDRSETLLLHNVRTLLHPAAGRDGAGPGRARRGVYWRLPRLRRSDRDRAVARELPRDGDYRSGDCDRRAAPLHGRVLNALGPA
jgi:predicted dehydrogenase